VLPPGSMEVIRVRNGTRLPAGLYVCSRCGEVRGVTRELPADWYRGCEGEEIRSTCLCDGLICQRCGQRRRRRPVSNYYNLNDGRWWHVPHFAGLARECRACRSSD
jgi:hypothetical protein